MEEIKQKKSAITLPYYTLQSELIRLFHELVHDPTCTEHIERYGAEIKIAFGNALSWFNFVQNIAFNELPLSIHLTRKETTPLDVPEGINTLIRPGWMVLKEITFPKNCITFFPFITALGEINTIALNESSLTRPTGTSIDTLEHLKAQSERLTIYIQMLEHDFQSLPSFMSISQMKVPHFAKQWSEKNETIVNALKNAQERLDALIQENYCQTEQLFRFALTVTTETWNVVIDTSHMVSDLLETIAKKIKCEQLKTNPKRLATLHNQIARSTIYDLSHTLTYLISLSVTDGRNSLEVQEMCCPLVKKLEELHYLNWKNPPETEQFICAVDKGYWELITSLTALDAKQVTPIELSAPARLIFILDEAVTEQTDRAVQLRGVLQKTVESFLDKPHKSTSLRSIPKWRLRGKLIAKQKDQLVKVLSSAVTPHYYQLHAAYLQAYIDLCQDKRAVQLLKEHCKEIQMAFPIGLTFFYYTRELAYYQAPGSKSLDCTLNPKVYWSQTANVTFSLAVEVLTDIKNKQDKELPTSFQHFYRLLQKVANLAVNKTKDQKIIGLPVGQSTDPRQHVFFLSKRLNTTLKVLERHIEKLPCFISRLLWLPETELKEFDEQWNESNGTIANLFDEVVKGLDNALAANEAKFRTALLITANQAIWEQIPKVKKAFVTLSLRITKAAKAAKNRSCEYAGLATDLLIIHSHLVNTLIHDLEHHIAYLVPLLMTDGWEPALVKQCALSTKEALDSFCEIDWELETEDTSPLANEVRRAIRVVEGAKIKMEKALEALDNGNTSPLILSAPLRLAMAINNAAVGIANQTLQLRPSDRSSLFSQFHRELVVLQCSFDKAMEGYSQALKI